LEQLLDVLTERKIDPAVTERLGEFLAHAPAQEVARIRPLALARRWGLPAEMVVAACLHGARAGLLVLLWDLLCPICRIPSEIKDTLRALRDHGHCPACSLDFPLDFGQSVELIFRVHSEIRETDLATYCIGGPAHSPHVVAQVRVSPSERIELDLALPEGAYRLCGPQLPYALDFRVLSAAPTRHWELSLDRAPGPELPRVLRAGGQVLALTNPHSAELLVRVERAAPRDDALTAARAASLALFRELFPDEVLSSGQLVNVATITLLVTILDGAVDLYDRLGDARAFALLHEHFRRLDDCVRREGGALLKTVGDGAVAAFAEAAAAVRAAVAVPDLLPPEALATGLRPGAAVHRGAALAATINDHLDYFGATVNQAMELRHLARGGEVLLTDAVAADPDVAALLHERGLRAELFETEHIGGLLHRCHC
jgi:class 3 adenylate cyclase